MSSYSSRRNLHSFPTRRSSDLGVEFGDRASLDALTAEARAAAPVNPQAAPLLDGVARAGDRKSTRLNSSHPSISYAVFRVKKKILTQEFKITDKRRATLRMGL